MHSNLPQTTPFSGPTATVGRLEDLLLPGPFATVSAILMVFAFWGWGQWIAGRLLGKQRASVLEESAGSTLAVALTAAFTHGLGLAGFVHIPTLRAFGIVLMATGCVIAGRSWRGQWGALRRAIASAWRHGDQIERAATVCSMAIVVALGLAALGPPTEADTLHYHLGVPLQWLRAGSIDPMPYWLHSRLTGLGEALILLGLVLGTDNLSGVLNWAGLLIAIAAVGSCVRRPSDRPFAVLLVTSVPVLTYLVTTEKPQLFPAAAILSAVGMLRRRRHALSAGILWLAFAAIAFAISCKHSFLFSGLIAASIGLNEARRQRRLTLALMLLTLTFLIFPGPVFVRNLIFYGDPISPMLEKWRPNSDPVVVTFAWYLKNFGLRHNTTNLVQLPFRLVFPTELSRLNGALGLGVLAILLARGARRPDRTMLWASVGLTFVIFVLGQWSARFFLEPYLWMIVALARENRRPLARILTAVVIFQGLLTLGMALQGVVSLTPGLLNARTRERIMVERAADYQLDRWLDEVLPPDAVVTGMHPNHTHLPRRFIATDYFNALEIAHLTEAEKRARIVELLDHFGVNAIVTYSTDPVFPFKRLIGASTPTLGILLMDWRAIRNPFVKKTPVIVTVVRYVAARNPHP